MSVLSFDLASPGAASPFFVTIRSETKLCSQRAFKLSTKVMRWSETILIIDLKSVFEYWRFYARKKGEHVVTYLGRLLRKTFGEYISIFFSCHPFQGALLANGRKKDTDICLGSPRGDAIYRSLCLDDLFLSSEEFSKILPEKERKSLILGKKKLERFSQRMMIEKIWDFQDIKIEEIEKRYGKWWGALFEWVLGKKEEIQQLSFLDEYASLCFPWCDEEFDDPPFIRRLLDFPLVDWGSLSELLTNDLKKVLKEDFRIRKSRIIKVHWKVVFENYKEETLEIRFRNPHSLLKDGPDFKTFLIQAEFSYKSYMEKMINREDDLDFPLEMGCVSWSLEFCEILYSDGAQFDFIEQGVDGADILGLENRLPFPLQRYSLMKSLFPEGSCQIITGEKLESPFFWEQSSRKRPLFTFKRVTPFLMRSSFKKSFLEEVSFCWWKKGEKREGERKYFVVEDEMKRLLWVFRDSEGKWYLHGIFS